MVAGVCWRKSLCHKGCNFNGSIADQQGTPGDYGGSQERSCKARKLTPKETGGGKLNEGTKGKVLEKQESLLRLKEDYPPLISNTLVNK